MTGQDLISSSMRLINVLASGETLPAADANDALVVLNQMIDSWTIEKLMIFNSARTVVVPASLKQAYTVGVGGDFNMARPPRIDRVDVLSLTDPANPLELELKLLNDDQWADIPVKTVSSALPRKVWDDGGFPLRTLSFWPIPNVQVNFAIYSWTALSQFADLTTDYTFPPGYLKAIRYNLAVDLAAEFGAQVTPVVAAIAIDSKAGIKSMNVQPVILRCDPALTGRGGAYDWRSDT